MDEGRRRLGTQRRLYPARTAAFAFLPHQFHHKAFVYPIELYSDQLEVDDDEVGGCIPDPAFGLISDIVLPEVQCGDVRRDREAAIA